MCRKLFAVLAFGIAANLFSANNPEALLRTASAVAQTNFTSGLALCDKAVSEFPTNARPLMLRARLFETARRYDDAIRDLTAALKLEPKSAPFWQGRGEMNF